MSADASAADKDAEVDATNMPAFFDEGEFDCCRFEVFTRKWIEALRRNAQFRAFTLKKHLPLDVAKDSVSGLREANYTTFTSTIYGVPDNVKQVVKQTSAGPVRAYTMQLRTVDGGAALDVLYDPLFKRYYRVLEATYSPDPTANWDMGMEGLAFWALSLEELPLYSEG